MELIVATKNRKKLEEIKHIFRGFNLKIVSLLDLPASPRIVENGKTFSDNAKIKALKIAKFTGKLTLGEDSGLEVFALGKKPGVYSSRFGGYPKSDERNNRKLLGLLNKVSSLKRRKAQYVSAVALADSKGIIKVTLGTCQGQIGFEPKGKSGFGYDPLFIIPSHKKTFAELGPRIKHRMSHRFIALNRVRMVLKKYLEAAKKH